jgi:hypothetical protein
MAKSKRRGATRETATAFKAALRRFIATASISTATKGDPDRWEKSPGYPTAEVDSLLWFDALALDRAWSLVTLSDDDAHNDHFVTGLQWFSDVFRGILTRWGFTLRMFEIPVEGGVLLCPRYVPPAAEPDRRLTVRIEELRALRKALMLMGTPRVAASPTPTRKAETRAVPSAEFGPLRIYSGGSEHWAEVDGAKAPQKLTDEQHAFVVSVVDARGGWIAFSDMKIRFPLLNDVTHQSRLLGSIPNAIRRHIENRKGKGYRIKAASSDH